MDHGRSHARTARTILSRDARPIHKITAGKDGHGHGRHGPGPDRPRSPRSPAAAYHFIARREQKTREKRHERKIFLPGTRCGARLSGFLADSLKNFFQKMLDILTPVCYSEIAEGEKPTAEPIHTNASTRKADRPERKNNNEQTRKAACRLLHRSLP